MEIEFINHASYIISSGNVSLLTDPWIEGTAFYEGWGLIEPTKFSYQDFERITHIWFSHEHPDHFSPPNLKKIPEEIRKKITILFQKTKDKKVIKFCQQLGFKECIELPPHWYNLDSNVKLLNVPHSDGDSWLCLKTDKHTVLNINDCVLENTAQVEHIKSSIGSGKIDVLLAQFSYANWAGNNGEIEIQKWYAAKKVTEIEREIATLKPRYTIPFASFVWFCHAENFYMNEGINKIDFIYDHLKKNPDTEPVVLFPGEKWDIEDTHDSISSVNKWVNSYKLNITEGKTIKPKSISETDLLSLGSTFIGNLKKANSIWMRLFLKPSYIYVDDYQKSYRLSLNGFEKTETAENKCDIKMSSDSLQYCFKFLWGGSTARINGRYQLPKGGSFYNWKMYFQTSELNNHGERFDLRFIITSLSRNLRRKLHLG